MHWNLKLYKKLAKGFRGRKSRCKRMVVPVVEKAQARRFYGRKVRRRMYRKEWIIKINAATREHRLSYSQFIWALNRSNIDLNRHTLADLAQFEPFTFKAIVDEVKMQLNPKILWEDEVGIYDAIGRGFLIHGDVLDPEERPAENKFTIENITIRDDIPEHMKGKIQILNE